MKKTLLIILMVTLGASSIKAQISSEIFRNAFNGLGATLGASSNESQSAPYKEAPSSSELVIGTISGEASYGESYDHYKWEESFFHGDWEYVKSVDDRKYYSENELYEKCLKEAKSKYGTAYPNLVLRSFKYRTENRHFSDHEYYTQRIGSSDKYKNTEREAIVYIYSATVVIEDY